MEAAKRVSQRVAHSSTHRNAGGLIFRVRDGYGRNPAAVAAVTPTSGIEPLSCQYRWCVQDRCIRVVQFASGPVRASRIQCDCSYECVAWPVSARGLNTSLPWCVHPESIDLVFYEWPRWYLFFRWVSSLDAFSSYPVVRRCPARALSDSRYTSGTHS